MTIFINLYARPLGNRLIVRLVLPVNHDNFGVSPLPLDALWVILGFGLNGDE